MISSDQLSIDVKEYLNLRLACTVSVHSTWYMVVYTVLYCYAAWDRSLRRQDWSVMLATAYVYMYYYCVECQPWGQKEEYTIKPHHHHSHKSDDPIHL